MASIILWIISVSILIGIIQGSKILLKYLPSKCLKIKEVDHEKVDKVYTWAIGIIGGLIIIAAVFGSSERFSYGYLIVRRIIPFVISWVVLTMLAIICLAIEAYFTRKYYMRKHGMDKEDYGIMLENRRKELTLYMENNYGQPSGVVDFINDSPYGMEYFLAFFFHDKRSLIMVKDDKIMETIPYVNIIKYYPDKKSRLIKRATSRTKTKTYFFGLGSIFFGAGSRSKSKTIYNEAIYEYTYYITLVLKSSQEFPHYTMCIGTDEKKFQYIRSLLDNVRELKLSDNPQPDTQLKYPIVDIPEIEI